MTWLIVALGLTALIFLHELAHVSVARLVGMKPRALYVGFPPAIAKVERNCVEYGVGAIDSHGHDTVPNRPANTR